LQACAFACAPLYAHAEVKAIAHYITTSPAGAGAVRECCDLLITASGHYQKLLKEFQPSLTESHFK
jgi:3-deoxy-D-manno-octulosonate 8-phosphate phosphatase (KDO 8-P phosphatase)